MKSWDDKVGESGFLYFTYHNVKMKAKEKKAMKQEYNVLAKEINTETGRKVLNYIK